MRDKIIRLEGLCKYYEGAGGRFDALTNVHLEVGAGEFAAVVGKSGSGKSTLLNMLTGIDHPTSGTVTIGSQAIHEMSENRLSAWRGANIGIVFQFFQLIPTLTILENIVLPMDFVGVIRSRDRKRRAEALLADVGILAHKDKFPSGLSGGEQQRAAIARALANNPPILVADEPTGNLDTRTADDVQAIFADLVENGKTVVVVTHENVSRRLYHRVITLADGTIVGDVRSAA